MSEAAAPSADRLPKVRAAELPDFSERLSPMLVKELRQGLRSPVFVWGLIVMNLFLATVVFLIMLDPGEDELHQAFFGAYCVLVCGLLPLRAAGALHDELRGNTIDTLVLTELNGWRITVGKWVAVVAQQILATVTVLPYLIVRYFAGGINVPMELAWLGIFLLTGMLAAAVLTGFSWVRYFLFRAVVMLAVTWITGAFCVEVLDGMFGYSRDYLLDSFFRDGGWGLIAIVTVAGLHLGFFCLEFAAARVSALSEPKAIRRRLVATAVLGIYLTVIVMVPPVRRNLPILFLMMVWLAGTLALTGLQALFERPVLLVSVVLPWVRRGRKGRLAGRFLYDGWPSGVCWFGLMLAVCVVGAGWKWWNLTNLELSSWGGYLRLTDQEVAWFVAGMGSIYAAIVAPLVMWRVLARRHLPWHLGTWVMFLVGLVIAQCAIMGLAGWTENNQMLKWGLPIPSMGFSWLADANIYERSRVFVETRVELDWDYLDIIRVSGLVSLAWWLAAGWCALVAFRRTTKVEEQALAFLKSGQVGPVPERNQPDILAENPGV